MSGGYVRRSFVTTALSILCVVPVLGLNVETHKLINRHAARTTEHFQEYLRTSLGFSSGLTTVLNGNSILVWLEEGGAREDDLLRFLRHFHDPLKPWDAAGLNLRISRHESSVRWMQHDQAGISTGASWSWRDARRLYYEALTEPDAEEREALWADLFRALGQIMHLVVDASVPEHSRNDMHPLGGMTSRSWYEYWVSSQHPTPPLEDAFVARFLSAPIGFVPDILQSAAPVGEQIAHVPVARLIDADRYDGGNPGVTAGFGDPRAPVSAGIAEIANANFYSEDTLRGTYPSPTDRGLVRVNLDTPFGLVRKYWSRPAGLGLLPANPLRAECASEAYAGEEPPYPCMDPVVWAQVAAHMLPRAVGYASGVLDYFFRGAVGVTRVEWTDSGITIRVQNAGDEEVEGVFEIYARHQPATAVERRTRLATLQDGEAVLLRPGQQRTFTLRPSADIVPTAAHVLVFTGRIGLEAQGVVGQVFTVPYVEVRQTSYDADLVPSCSRLPIASVSPPYPSGITTTIRLESMRCEWRVLNHRVSGTLQTNTFVDLATGRREPVIERIAAEWDGGDVRGPAPLMLDGRPVGSGWQRQGDEPDPLTFAIADPMDRGRSYLYLMVTYTNGTEVTAQLAIFTRPVSSHSKQLVLDNRTPSAPQYLVTSGRIASGFVAYNWASEGDMQSPLFEPVSHGGFSAPTNRQTERRFGGSRVFREGLLIDEEAYLDEAIDDFEPFADGDAAVARYTAIEPLVSPHPAGPVYVPVAEVRRRYQPMEVEFLRAFVTNNPEPFVVRLTGQVD